MWWFLECPNLSGSLHTCILDSVVWGLMGEAFRVGCTHVIIYLNDGCWSIGHTTIPSFVCSSYITLDHGAFTQQFPLPTWLFAKVYSTLTNSRFLLMYFTCESNNSITTVFNCHSYSIELSAQISNLCFERNHFRLKLTYSGLLSDMRAVRAYEGLELAIRLWNDC